MELRKKAKVSSNYNVADCRKVTPALEQGDEWIYTCIYPGKYKLFLHNKYGTNWYSVINTNGYSIINMRNTNMFSRLIAPYQATEAMQISSSNDATFGIVTVVRTIWLSLD